MSLAPIALFVYARPEHLIRTITALKKNELAASSDLFIFSDAAKTPDKELAVQAVRSYINSIAGFKSITIHHHAHNLGLSQSVLYGVNSILALHERIIVLEDDMETSPFFLHYMNHALEFFSNNDQVACIHGYVYPINQPLPEAFFLRGADCWGWGTWRRGWSIFNPDGRYLLAELKRRRLIKVFDFNGAYPFSRMLLNQIKGLNDSWAIRWHASAFLADMLTLHPGRSMVRNIGNDSSGTHCGNETTYDVELSANPIDLSLVEVKSSPIARDAFEAFYRSNQQSVVKRLMRRAKILLMQKT
jgi:hypothetical protein